MSSGADPLRVEIKERTRRNRTIAGEAGAMRLPMRLPMRIEWKITLLALAVIGVGAGVLISQTREFLMEQSLRSATEFSIQQMSPLKRLAQERIEERKAELVRFAASRVGAGSAHSEAFDVVAMMLPVSPTHNSDREKWTPGWIEKTADLEQQKWPAGYELTLLKSLPFSKVRPGEVLWVRLSDPRGLPIYAMVLSVEVREPGGASAATAKALSELPENVAVGGSANVAQAQKAMIVGFTSGNPLAFVTEGAIGRSSIVYLIDDRGYIASHVNKAYLGSSFLDEPLVREIVQKQKTAASAQFESSDRLQIQAHYERIDRTNLYVVISWPLGEKSPLEASQALTFFAAFIFVSALGLLIVWLYAHSIGRRLREAIAVIRAIENGSANSIENSFANGFATSSVNGFANSEEARAFAPTGIADEIGEITRLISQNPSVIQNTNNNQQSIHHRSSINPPGLPAGQIAGGKITVGQVATMELREPHSSAEDLARERKAALQSLSGGFAAIVKDRLLSILGHAQLARVKAEHDELRNHAESIERDARRLQDLVEQIEALADDGANKGAKIKDNSDLDEKIDLIEVIEAAVSIMQTEYDAEGMTIEKELQRVPLIRGSTKLIKAALIEMLRNSKEAMEARFEKQLRIQLSYRDQGIVLTLTDTGIGMTSEACARAFEPFYREFESPDRFGLGLAKVQACMARLGGHCEVRATPGEGSVFTLKFPVGADDRKDFLTEDLRTLSNQVDSLYRAASTALSAAEAPNLITPTHVHDDDDDVETMVSVSLSKLASPVVDKASGAANPDDESELLEDLPQMRPILSREPAAGVSVSRSLISSASNVAIEALDFDELGDLASERDTSAEIEVKIRRPQFGV
jgi:signal transduction histidine kinase